MNDTLCFNIYANLFLYKLKSKLKTGIICPVWGSFKNKVMIVILENGNGYVCYGPNTTNKCILSLIRITEWLLLYKKKNVCMFKRS